VCADLFKKKRANMQDVVQLERKLRKGGTKVARLVSSNKNMNGEKIYGYWSVGLG